MGQKEACLHIKKISLKGAHKALRNATRVAGLAAAVVCVLTLRRAKKAHA